MSMNAGVGHCCSGGAAVVFKAAVALRQQSRSRSGRTTQRGSASTGPSTRARAFTLSRIPVAMMLLMSGACGTLSRRTMNMSSGSAVAFAFRSASPGTHSPRQRQLQQSPRLFSSKSKAADNAGDESNTSTSPSQPQTQLLQSVPFDVDVENALTASGYKRPTVNWYPGHIAKAERLLSETLKAVDVVVEVRDARAPKASAHPRVAEWAAGRPRVVVLTHIDSVPEAARSSWARSYDEFGAGRWDAAVDKQVRNKARQGLVERGKYADDTNSGGSSKKRRNNDNGQAAPAPVDAAVSGVESVLFVDAKRGAGIHAINRAVLRAGAHVNERRSRRGLSDRPLRVGIIGYPNVGKSALINKILGKKRARTANTPGITKTLQWIRVRTDDNKKKSRGKEFELLDSPGIIPANMVDQSDALLLAACNSIGTAAYDNQAVAAYLCEWLKTLHLMGKGELTAPKWRKECLNRYGFDPLVPPAAEHGEGEDRLLTGEDMVFKVADASCRGSPEDASRKILQDFRAGRMGPISLQLAPQRVTDEGQVRVDVRRGVAAVGGGTGTLAEGMIMAREERERLEAEERDERARAAVETAKERGLELPPMVEQKAAAKAGDGAGSVSVSSASVSSDEQVDDSTGTAVSSSSSKRKDDNSDSTPEEEVGKGLFDGW